MEQFMEDVGFSDGFSIPVANNENKSLEAEVRELQKERENLLSNFEDGSERLESVKNYMHSIIREQEENQKLLAAWDSQIRYDDSAVKVRNGQFASLTAEKKDLNKSKLETEQRQIYYQEETGRMAERVEQLRVQVQWDQGALQAWSAAADRISDDYAVLQLFSQQDQQRFSHLELKRQHLRQEVESKRLKFEEVTGDVLNLEQTLQKIGHLFQNQQQDRQALVDQWYSAVRVLQQRDEDIYRVVAEIGGLRAQAKQRMRELEEQKTVYANEDRNNREVEREAARLEREVRDAAESVQHLENVVSDLIGQFQTIRGALTTTSRLAQNNRNNVRRIGELCFKKREQIQKFELILEDLHVLKNETQGQNISANDRVYRLEKIKFEVEDTLEKIRLEQTKVREKLRLMQEELNRLRTIEREQRRNMSGLEVNAQTLRLDTCAAVAEQRRHYEMLYKVEMAYLEKDLEYKRMLGLADPMQAEKCKEKINKLEPLLRDAVAAHQLLEKEVYRIDQQYRRLVTALETDDKEETNLKAKKQELVLMIEGGVRALANLRTRNQDGQVDENVIRLRVKHIENALKKVGGQLYSLERQRLELDEAVQERSLEVEALLDVLHVKKRALGEELAALNSNINVAKLKVEHLQSKHELAMQSMSSGDGDVISVTQLKIKAAQERYELQEMGDKLDAKIKTTEREITAMENTLQAVHAANSCFKTTLSRVSADETQLQEKESLEANYLAAVEQLRGKRMALENLQEASAELENNLQSQLEVEASLLKQAATRANDLSDLGRRLDAQGEKQNRAARDIRLMMKQLHGVQNKLQSFEEKDMWLREVRDQNQSALHQLGEMAVRVMETGPVVARYLRDRGLSLPQHTPSTKQSSRTSSIASGSFLTIQSSTLGDGEKLERRETVHRRPSILKAESKGSTIRKTSHSDHKLASPLDIVDLVVPKPK